MDQSNRCLLGFNVCECKFVRGSSLNQFSSGAPYPYLTWPHHLLDFVSISCSINKVVQDFSTRKRRNNRRLLLWSTNTRIIEGWLRYHAFSLGQYSNLGAEPQQLQEQSLQNPVADDHNCSSCVTHPHRYIILLMQCWIEDRFEGVNIDFPLPYSSFPFISLH